MNMQIFFCLFKQTLSLVFDLSGFGLWSLYPEQSNAECPFHGHLTSEVLPGQQGNMVPQVYPRSALRPPSA